MRHAMLVVLMPVLIAVISASARSADGTAEPPVRQPAETLRSAPVPDGFSPYLPDGRTLSGDGTGAIPCRCVYQGRRFQVGETACIRLPEASRAMRCVLIQNNTSWIPAADESGCEVARVM